MRFYWVLLIFAFYSCDFIPRIGEQPVTIIVNDTIFVVKEKIVNKTVIDTIYKTIEIPLAKSEHQVFIDTLKSYLGTKEATGNNDGKAVNMFSSVACDAENVMWCASFIGYGLTVNGHEIPELGCWSKAYFPKHKVTWTRGDERKLLKGELFGLYFRNLGRIGHIGAIVEDLGDGYVITIEGNTNSAGDREGNGVFQRIRHKSQLYVVSDWII